MTWGPYTRSSRGMTLSASPSYMWGRNSKCDIKIGDRVAHSQTPLSQGPYHCARLVRLQRVCKRRAKGGKAKIITTRVHQPHTTPSSTQRLPKAQNHRRLYAISRCPSHFAFMVTDGLRSAHSAPVICAGLTVYSALTDACTSSHGMSEQHLKRVSVGVV